MLRNFFGRICGLRNPDRRFLAAFNSTFFQLERLAPTSKRETDDPRFGKRNGLFVPVDPSLESFSTERPKRPYSINTTSKCGDINLLRYLHKDSSTNDTPNDQHSTKRDSSGSNTSNRNDGGNSSGGNKKYIIFLLGILLTSGVLYKLWSSGYFTTSKPEVKRTSFKKKKRKVMVEKIPISSSDIPSEIPYLLIGGGTASFSAFRAIKSIDPKAMVMVISNEPFNPYMRPPLSKEMWYNENRKLSLNLEFKQWNGTERSLFYEPNDFYTECSNLTSSENGGVAIAKGWSVKSIDATNHEAVLDDGKIIKYKKCLIATGAKPKNLKVFEEAPAAVKNKITFYRGILDFKELEESIQNGAKSILIVGGGFLGSELACALSRRGKTEDLKVTQVFKEEGNMSGVLPHYLSEWTTKKVESEGVRVISKAKVDDIVSANNCLQIHLSNGAKVSADLIIVAVGVEPNVELAKTSGLELDPNYGGFVVNTELEARSNLYAAGDCACFYDVKLGRRRVEHHDHAVVSGRLAGENMTGAGKPYSHQSMFWSDLGPEVGYEAIGIIDASLPTVGVYARPTISDTPEALVVKTGDSIRDAAKESASSVEPEKVDSPAAPKPEKDDSPAAPKPEKDDSPAALKSEKDDSLAALKPERDNDSLAAPKPGEDYGKGVVFYIRNEIVVGIVLWNVFNRMSVARQVIKDERKYEDLNEVAKLFNIHG